MIKKIIKEVKILNKCCLITGGDRGLGKAISTIFAHNGYDIIMNYVKNKEMAESLSQELVNTYGIKVVPIQADISDENQVKEMYKTIGENFSKIDVIVNNAAIFNDSIFLDKNSNDFDKVYKVNVIGAFLICKYARDYLSENSSIINITSTNALDTHYTYAADYDASKAALISLTNNLAVEFAPKTRVNAIAAGWINTDTIKEEVSDEFKNREIEKILLKRFSEPEEIAEVVMFLASDKASYINKTVIRVDGGFYLK